MGDSVGRLPRAPPEAEPAFLETADKGDDDEAPPPDDGPKVVSLDQFRKK